MSIRDMKMLGIGETGDTGGTETTGTLMAKENAILGKTDKLAQMFQQSNLLYGTIPSCLLKEIAYVETEPIQLSFLYSEKVNTVKEVSLTLPYDLYVTSEYVYIHNSAYHELDIEYLVDGTLINTLSSPAATSVNNGGWNQYFALPGEFRQGSISDNKMPLMGIYPILKAGETLTIRAKVVSVGGTSSSTTYASTLKGFCILKEA